MNRRSFLGFTLAAVGGIFVPKYERWFQPKKIILPRDHYKVTMFSTRFPQEEIERFMNVDRMYSLGFRVESKFLEDDVYKRNMEAIASRIMSEAFRSHI